MDSRAHDIYGEIIERTRVMLGCHGAFMALVTESGDPVVKAQSGLSDGPLVGRRIPCGEGLAGVALREGRSQISDDYVADPRSVNELRDAALCQEFVSVAATPLVHAGENIGVLYGAHDSPGYFTAHHLQFLEAFAVGAVLAVRLARTAEELSDTLAERDAFFEEAPDPMIIHTLDDARIVDVNRHACETYGYSRDEFLQLTIADLDSPEHAPAMRARLMRIGRDGHAVFSTEHRTADGRLLEVDVAATLLTYHDGREVAHTVSRNVTVRRELERRLRNSERIASLGKLVAGVTQELNTPLTIILGISDLTGEELLDPIVREDILSIRREASRAAQIVRDLQVFAQTHEKTPHMVQLNDIVRRVFDKRRPLRQSRSVEGTLHLDPDAPPLWGDEHNLEQVVSNLLANAETAAADGARDHEVSVHTRTAIDDHDHSVWVELSVIDSGPGVAPGDLPRLFDPFFTTRGPGEGLGLGLSLCHGIIGDMGGSLMAVNRVEGGTWLRARFPAVSGEDPAYGLYSLS